MLVKQNQQQITANINKLHASILPAVLLDGSNEKSTPDELAKVEATSNRIKSHLQKNFTDARGITDFSFENLRATVLALVDELHWSVLPRNYGARARAASQEAKNRIGLGHHRNEFDRPELNKPQPSVYEMQKETEENVRVNVATAATEKIISSHSGHTHARTNFERSLLRTERDRLVQQKVDPEAIREAIEKQVREMKPSALGS